MPAEKKSDKAPATTDEPKPAAAPAAIEPAPTPEQLQADAQEFINALNGNSPRAQQPAEDEPDDEVPPSEEPKPEDKPKDEPAPAPAPDPKPKKPYKPGKTEEEIEAIARRVADEREQERQAALAKPADEPAKPKTPQEEFNETHLSDDDRDYLVTLKELEEINPGQKGIVEKQRRFFKAASELKARYELKNGAGSFNPNDEEHAEFYRRHEVFVPPRDLKAAERSLTKKSIKDDLLPEVQAQVRKEYEPELAELRAERARKDALPKIRESVGAAVEDIFKAVPEFEKLVEPGKLNAEAVAKMAEINPVVHHHVTEEAELVYELVEELENLNHLGRHHPFDPAKTVTLSSGRTFQPAVVIMQTFQELETKMAKAPKAERLDEGRDFITNADRNARIQAIQSSAATPEVKARQMADLKNNYWSIAPENIRNTILNKSKARIAGLHKKFSSYTKTHAPEVPGGTQQTPPKADQPKPSAKSALPRGTNISAVSDISDNSNRIPKHRENEDEEFAKALRGR